MTILINSVRKTSIGYYKGHNWQGFAEIFEAEQDAINFSNTGDQPVEYKGFHITNLGYVYRDKKRVFIADWQSCGSVERAKIMIDQHCEQTNYQRYQQEQYGNVLREPVVNPDGSHDGTEEEMERSARWVERQHQIQMNQYER